MANKTQTDIFDYLNDNDDEVINCTIRVSQPIKFGEYKRHEKHFTSLRLKEQYLKSLNIAVHRKSKFKQGLEYVMLKG